MIDKETFLQAWSILEKIEAPLPLNTVLKIPYKDINQNYYAKFLYTFGDKVGDPYKWRFVGSDISELI